MKRIKIIVSLMLIFIGQIFIGEVSLYYLDNFANDIAYTTIIYQPGINAEEMKQDILASSKEHNIDFFVIKNDVININEKNIVIYQSDKNVEKRIFDVKNIQQKEYSSLFSGSTNIVFEDYKKISKSDLEVNNTYYVFGEADNIKAFKMQLIDEYAGNHPVFPDRRNSFSTTVFGMWTIIFGLCVLFSVVYIQTRKKDSFIKIVYGEKQLSLVLKEALLDILFITFIAVFLQKILAFYTNTQLYKFEFYLLLSIFTIINTALYFLFFRFNIKKIYENKMAHVVSFLYILRIISIVLVSLVITMNIAMAKEAVEFISQEDFFKEHKDYYYTNIGYIPREGRDGKPKTTLEDNARIKEIFYKKNYEDFKPMMLVSFGESDNTDIIFANRNSISYLGKEINLLNAKSLEDKCYYILPSSMKENQSIIQSLDLRLENYIDNKLLEKREMVYYKDTVSIINIDDLLPLNSKTSKNPIIILDNSVPEFLEQEIIGNPFRTTFDRNIMYKVDESSFDKFIEDYNLISEINGKSNVYEIYLKGKLTMQRVLKMAFVMSLILIFFELTVLLTLIKLEFRLNAYKISIRKILGYSRLQRYSKLSVYSLIGSVIAMTIFIVATLYLKMVPMFYGVLVILLLYLTDQLLISREIKKIERRNIHLVLKGEFR